MSHVSARSRAAQTSVSASASSDDHMTTLLIGSLNRIGTDASLILASQSPRRVEILDMMGLAGRFTQTPSPLDEEALQIELATQTVSPEDYAKILAERKAEALGLHLMKSSDGMSELTTFILGSDTIVDLNGHILNKPVDEADAVRMLQSLSGNWHRVHTGVALYKVCKSTEVTLVSSFTDTANVEFAGLSQEDIEAYVNTKEPLDKAGSYGIQGIGGQLVARMEGDFFTVMGLPMHRVSKALAEAMADL